MKRSLVGQVALVTGASRGVGRGIALQLAEAGAKVYVTGREPNKSLSAKDDGLPSLEQTVFDIRERNGIEVPPMYCTENRDSNADVVDKICNTDGRLDILVNNAFSGITAMERDAGKKFYESDPKLWDEILDVNLRGAYMCSMRAARMMTDRDRGLIVNISSAGSLQHFFNVPYGVGKTAMNRLTADMAFELKGSRVACVCVWPGVARTELNLRLAQDSNESVTKLTGMSLDAFRRALENGESPEYVGRAVVALASDENVTQKSGKIVLTADLGDEYGFVDIDGRKPSNMRSVRSALEFFGWYRLANFVPSFLRIPCMALHASTNQFYKF